MVLTIFKVGWEKFCSAVENTRNPLSELYSCFIYVTKSKNCFDSQIQFGECSVREPYWLISPKFEQGLSC